MVRFIVEHQMFFMPIRSGITRWAICPSVSRLFRHAASEVKQRPHPIRLFSNF